MEFADQDLGLGWDTTCSKPGGGFVCSLDDGVPVRTLFETPFTAPDLFGASCGQPSQWGFSDDIFVDFFDPQPASPPLTDLGELGDIPEEPPSLEADDDDDFNLLGALGFDVCDTESQSLVQEGLEHLSTVIGGDSTVIDEATRRVDAMRQILWDLEAQARAQPHLQHQLQVHPAPTPPTQKAMYRPQMVRCTQCYRDHKTAGECEPGMPGESCARCARAGVPCTSTTVDGRVNATRRCMRCTSRKYLRSRCRPSSKGGSCDQCTDDGIECMP